MSLQAEILAALQAVPGDTGVRLDPNTARRWAAGLHRALGSEALDATDYVLGRAYCLNCRLPRQAGWPWRATLRVCLSGVGPFVPQVFIRSYLEERWWAGAVGTSRSGWLPEHEQALQRLRAWYLDNDLKEVDPDTAAQPAPAEVRVPGLRGGELILHGALFYT